MKWLFLILFFSLNLAAEPAEDSIISEADLSPEAPVSEIEEPLSPVPPAATTPEISPGVVEKSPIPEVVGPGAPVGTVEAEAPPVIPGGVPGEVAEGAEPVPEDPSPIASLFSVEENPGKGSLSFIRGDATRVVKFGKAHGHYGLALVFDTKNLPNPYRSEFGHNVVVQIVMGKIPSAREGQAFQFGSAAILTKYLPKDQTSFPISSMPKGPEKRVLFERSALLMFSDPENPAAQSDEDKLRNTFFGVAGSLSLKPVGKPRVIALSAEGESVMFYSQIFTLTFDSAVGTPFNPIDSTLQGSVEIPIYWAQSPNAQALMDGISKEILTGPDIKFSLPEPPRKVTSEPKTLKPRRKTKNP